MNKAIVGIIGATVFLLIGIVALGGNSAGRSSAYSGSAAEIVSEPGIHWHADLSISIKGQKQEIPANIGLGGLSYMGMEPLHTHDNTGQIHAEWPTGPIYKGDLVLARFFEQWGKTFTNEQILDAKTIDGGKITMIVNGESNSDLENYVMKDKDKIEIRYE